jgi:hypothetical protein
MRATKLAMMPLSTSKHMMQLLNNSDNFHSHGSMDDSADEGYCVLNEWRILQEWEYSQYGTKFTSEDRKMRNEQIYCRLNSNDYPLSVHDTKSMWSTIIAPLINNQTSGVLIGKKFELDNEKTVWQAWMTVI